MKGVSFALALVCVLVMALPLAAMPFLGSSTQMENREDAPPPSLTLADGGLNQQFATDFENWFLDHFGFRDRLVGWNAWINLRLLRTSSNEDVIVGRDGMLFFRETVPDYTGSAPLTPGELAAIRANVRRLALSIRQRGGNLYIAVAPNKNTVYPENMPNRYPWRGDGGNPARLRRALEGTGAIWIELLPALRDAKKDGQAYCLTDTHWSGLGARRAAGAILGAMGGRALPELQAVGKISHSGDLARMLGLGGSLVEQLDRYLPDDRDAPDYGLHDVACEGRGEGRLLMLRDSFGTAIGPFITPAYEGVRLRWENPFQATGEADDVLILIAERNIRLYLGQPAEAPAPEVEVAIPAAARRAPCTFEASREGAFACVDFRFGPLQYAGEAYLLIDDAAYWATPLSGGQTHEPGWFRALIRPEGFDAAARIRALCLTGKGRAWVSGDDLALGDLAEPGAAVEEDDLDDFEDLRRLRQGLIPED